MALSNSVLPTSYQRLYFRNANHPIARPSVTTRRQDRSAANVQVRAQEVGTEKEADRRFILLILFGTHSSFFIYVQAIASV